MPYKRSLYQCFNARCQEKRINCSKGHILGFPSKDGTVGILRLARGTPLELAVCQECVDYDEMGGRVAREDRGWL